MVYKADVSKLDQADVADSMTILKDVVERRVNQFGVSEAIVQVEKGGALSSKEGAYKLIVELPGVTDVDEAARSIGATPSLEFKLITAQKLQELQNTLSSENSVSTSTMEAYYAQAFTPTGLDGSMISKASLQFNQTTNLPLVGLQFTSQGRELFAKVTKEHTGDYLGIFLDGKNIETPIIEDAILNGQAQISGNFTTESAAALVRSLNYGALPIPISLIGQNTIGPSLGQAAVDGGIRAGLISFLIISVFLLVWYRLPGLVAVVALAVYTALMLALFKLIPVTLTAAGIAGFIITIGMAVDANILIFERMKEELVRGRGVSEAMHEGFARAWTSIRDSNISSIITGAVLFYYPSTSIIKGFALVFIIGVAISMFTAITASRLFLYAIAPQKETKLSRFLISNGFK